jgi:DnaJ family protein C protein 22
MKRTGFAYFFALIGGIFGFHHLYLGRTQHALLWLTTFGGFGIGILYEIIFAIKKYVQEANNDNQIRDEYQRKMREQRSPAFELIRFCGKKKTLRNNSIILFVQRTIYCCYFLWFNYLLCFS